MIVYSGFFNKAVRPNQETKVTEAVLEPVPEPKPKRPAGKKRVDDAANGQDAAGING